MEELMDGLMLFAETPRAGELGHRFLVASDSSISETEIAPFCGAVADRISAGGISFGANFIALRRDVEQRVSGGAVRNGSEIIVLAGVDVSNVCGRALAPALELLQAYQGQLERLVTSQIDWNSAMRTDLIVRRPELAEWLKKVCALSLPSVGWRDGPRPLFQSFPPEKRANSWTNLSLTAILYGMGLAVASGVGAGVGSNLWAPNSNNQVASKVDNSPTGKPHPPDGTSKIVPSATGAEVSRTKDANNTEKVAPSFESLLQAAINAGKAETVADLISWLSSDGIASTLDFQPAIEFCSFLVEKGSFDEGLRVAQQLSLSAVSSLLNPDQRALLEDSIRKAREGNESIDHSDRKLYEAIIEYEGKKQLEAARAYLRKAPRQAMNKAVSAWMEWSEKAIDVEVVDFKPPTDGRWIIRFGAKGREVGFTKVNESVLPLVFNTAHFGITARNLPATLSAVAQRDDERDGDLESLRLEGNVQLTRQSSGERTVTLKSKGLIRNSATLKIQLPSSLEMPTLPDWKRSRDDRN